MSESTDTTQVLPLADSPQAQVDPDATVTMPVVEAPVALTMDTAKAQQLYPSAPAVAVPYDARRAHLMHQHRVLGRILSTASLPTPDQVTLHTYGNGIELMIRNDLDGSALAPFVAVFGGKPSSVDRDNQWTESGRARCAELLTVVDGVNVRVWSLTYLPAAAQPQPEPVAEPETAPEPVAAAEPEPEHNPAPAPQPTEAA